MLLNSPLFLLLCLSLFFSQCAPPKPVFLLKENFREQIPHLLAVLPFDNLSVDLDATPLIRPIVQQRLLYKGYHCLPLDQIDKTLKEKGVMVSHDVYMFTAQELGTILGADALVYGTITEFNKHYAFLYSDIVVGLSLQMIDAKTGEVLWKDERISRENTLAESLFLASRYQTPEEILTAILAYNAMFAVLAQYRPYAESAVREALFSLPPGPEGETLYPWDLEHSVWENDLVNSWLQRSPIIPAYSPRMNLSEKPSEHAPKQKSDSQKKKPEGKKKKPNLQIQKPGPEPKTGIIINLNPEPQNSSRSKTPEEKKPEDKSASPNQ